MYTSYNNMGRKLQQGLPFTGNCVTAKLNTRTGKDGTRKQEYVVYSYRTAIFRQMANLDTGRVVSVLFNNHFYSMTTRRIQGVILRAGIVPDGFPLTEKDPRGGIHSISVVGVYGEDGWKVE